MKGWYYKVFDGYSYEQDGSYNLRDHYVLRRQKMMCEAYVYDDDAS